MGPLERVACQAAKESPDVLETQENLADEENPELQVIPVHQDSEEIKETQD